MNILIVDDHPLTVEGYCFAIAQATLFQKNTSFTKAYDCKSAYEAIRQSVADQRPFDLAILDFSLPPYPEKDLVDGSTLARYLMKENPYCKTAIITAHTEVVVIYDIVKNTRPHALVVKRDLSPSLLPEILKKIYEGESFQSATVIQCNQEIWKKELMLDDNNRQILLLLSKGYKLSELHHSIPLAEGTVKKRLSKMKEAFCVSDTNSLIQEAFKCGFV